jgi:hypothetical protein
VFAVSPAACGGDEEADEGESTTTAPSDDPSTDGPTTTAPSVEAEVEAAYLAYLDMSDRLAREPDPQDPEIDERATGPARDMLVTSLTKMNEEGVHIEFGPSYSHDVVNVEVSGETAVVTDCFIDEGFRVHDAAGERVEFPATQALHEVSMSSADGTWLVQSVIKSPASAVEPTCGS